jgi:cation diffusion facilitator CzcD-associated flavoprotein CzcO
MKEFFDIVIVGSGASGAAAAWRFWLLLQTQCFSCGTTTSWLWRWQE